MVPTPSSQVLALGTEFGVHVGPTGVTDVHVLDGEGLVKSPKVKARHLLDGNPGRFSTDARQTITVDKTAFAPIGSTTFKRATPIRLQFDVGYAAGLYRGTQSPAVISPSMKIIGIPCLG